MPQSQKRHILSCPNLYQILTDFQTSSGIKFGRKKLDGDSTLSYGENPESLSHLGFGRYRVVTDRQTPRRMDGQNCSGVATGVQGVRAVPGGNG